jgi:hypothetical protein
MVESIILMMIVAFAKKVSPVFDIGYMSKSALAV